MTINTKYTRLLSFTKHYIFLLLLASLFLLAACSSSGSNPSTSDSLSNLSIADATTLEGAKQIKFIVSLSDPFPGGKDVVFNYRTLETTEIAGNAIADADYTSVVAGRATIDSGTLTTSILIDITDDSLVEDDETFLVEISPNQLDIPIIKPQAIGTIKIDDLPSLSITDATAFEDTGQIEFTVSLNQAFPGNIVSFDYHTLDSGSASSGADYTSVVAGRATINSNEPTTKIIIEINDDSLIEDDETFDLVISNPPPNILITRARATGTIKINGLSLSIADATTLEGAGSIKFRVSLSAPFPGGKDVVFNYRTLETTKIAGNAIADSDYTSVVAGRATIDSGNLTTSISIDITDDSLVEDDETFLVEISPNQLDIPIIKPQAIGTIKIDDLPSLSITDATAFEDTGQIEFTVSLNQAFPGNIVSFDYRTLESGSAIENVDYTSVVAGSATINSGEPTTKIIIEINDDSLIEEDETFDLVISNPPPNILITRARATGTIKINGLSLSIADATTLEGAGSIKFRVSLSAPFPGGKDVVFNYRTLETTKIAGNAIADSDYTSVVAGRATIDSGNLTTSISIDITDDSLVEDDETFLVEISPNQLDIPIIKPQAIGTIKIDDLPSLSITDATAFEDTGQIEFTVSLNQAFPGNIVSFDYHTLESGSAIENVDYTSVVDGRATIDSGEPTTKIIIEINDDSLIEDDETFDLVISNPPPNILITRARATGTIKINGLSLSIADATTLEGADSIKFRVSLSALFPGGKDVVFNYRTLESGSINSASAGADYTSKAGRATINSGTLTTSILIDITDDSLVEDDETFLVEISPNKLDIPIIKPQAIGTIKIDDMPSLSITDATAFENAGVLTFRASLNAPFPGNLVSFDYQTKKGSANNQITWQQATEHARWSARDGHSSVVFKDKIWVLGGNTSVGSTAILRNDVYYSSDGSNWHTATTNAAWTPRHSHTSVVFKDKIWVLGGSHKNDIYYSTDGINWVEATADAAWTARAEHSSVVFKNKMWVMGGWDGVMEDGITGRPKDVWSSDNGINWTSVTANAAWSGRTNHSSVVFDDKIWVMGGNAAEGRKDDVWYSADGINWVQAIEHARWTPRHRHSSVVFDDKIWVLGGLEDNDRKNDVWYSSNGTNWTQSTSNVTWSERRSHRSVVFKNKIWVLGGYDDGSKSRFNDVYFADNTSDYLNASGSGFITGGERSTTIDIALLDDNTIEDDETFDIIISNPVNATLNTAAGDNQATGTILDIISWTQATANAGWIARSEHTSVINRDKIWVIGAVQRHLYATKQNEEPKWYSDAWHSDNGIDWTNNAGSSRSSLIYSAGHTSVTHNSGSFQNRILVMGGKNSDGEVTNMMQRTSQPIATEGGWKEIGKQFTARYAHTSVVFGGKSWILGGWNGSENLNDVWNTEIQGSNLNWSEVTTSNIWSARSEHSSVVFDGKIWVLGGKTDDGNENDVYYSSNGSDWNTATTNAAWSARSKHSSVEFDNKIWVLGGDDGNKKNDVWYSSNGADWSEVATSSIWDARSDHTSIVFNDKIWVLGGKTDDGNKNDVWFLGE